MPDLFRDPQTIVGNPTDHKKLHVPRLIDDTIGVRVVVASEDRAGFVRRNVGWMSCCARMQYMKGLSTP